MARITVEDCLDNIPNRFTLVLVTVERTKQLMKGAFPQIEDERANKEIVTALREIAAGHLTPDLGQIDENENVRHQRIGMSLDDVPPSDLPPEA